MNSPVRVVGRGVRAPCLPLLVLLLMCAVTSVRTIKQPPLEQLISDLDANADQRITAEELLARISSVRAKLDDQELNAESTGEREISAEEKQSIEEEFVEFDKDGSGAVSEAEALLQFEETSLDGEAEEAQADDEEEDAEASRRSRLEAAEIDEGYREVSREMERQTFRASDSNGDGSLDRDEWLLYRLEIYPEIHRTMQPR